MSDNHSQHKKILIIGAGFSGRGFIGRLLHENGCSIVFADKNEGLVKKLQSTEGYTVYLGANRQAYGVKGYTAYHMSDPCLIEAALEADYIFVSVGEGNLRQLGSFFQELCERKKASDIQVIVCENGLCPKRVLGNILKGTNAAQIQISQAAIFCTTISNDNGATLDILSENYNTMPYDVDDGLFTLPFASFIPQKHFDLLLKRKIYTYNCLSACIAYIGYCKGYTNYAAAANDPQIKTLCKGVKSSLDKVLSREFGVTIEEQAIFSQKALDKFRDYTIEDTIGKNARNAMRKLAPEERLAGPLKIMVRYGQDCSRLCRVIAAALYYLEREERMEYNGILYSDALQLFADMNCLPFGDETINCIGGYYRELRCKHG